MMKWKRLKPGLRPFFPRWIFVGVLLVSLLLTSCAGRSQPQTFRLPDTRTPTPGLPTRTPFSQPGSVLAFTGPEPASAILPRATSTQLTDCTYTLFYWRDHPENWLAENIIIGNLTYAQNEAVRILNEERRDQQTEALKQFFVAALNILKGADPTAIEVEMHRASVWLAAHPPGFRLNAEESGEALELTTALDAYNGGQIGPGLCPDQPSTATPEPTSTATPTATFTARPPVVLAPTTGSNSAPPEFDKGSGSFTPAATDTTPPEPTEPPPPPTQAGPAPTSTRRPPTQPPPPTDEPEPTPTSAPTEPPAPTQPRPTDPPPPTDPPAPTDPPPTDPPPPTSAPDPTESVPDLLPFLDSLLEGLLS